jgi:hypothetical protein
MLEISLLTRGKKPDEDYCWLTNRSVEEWWQIYSREGWIRTAYTDSPCLVIQSDGSVSKIFIGSIPSQRIDHMDRPIGLHISIRCPAEKKWSVILSPLIGAWLHDIGRARRENSHLLVSRHGAVSTIVDRFLTEDMVESWFAEENRRQLLYDIHQELFQQQWNASILTLIDEIQEWRSSPQLHDPIQTTPISESHRTMGYEEHPFIGDITLPDDRETFLTKARDILSGEVGVAIFANPAHPGTIREIGPFTVRAMLQNPPGIRILRTSEFLLHAEPNQVTAQQATPDIPEFPQPTSHNTEVRPSLSTIEPAHQVSSGHIDEMDDITETKRPANQHNHPRDHKNLILIALILGVLAILLFLLFIYLK